ncbi:MAG: HEPN domain-containing protein [Armatimonadota bacterium]
MKQSDCERARLFLRRAKRSIDAAKHDLDGGFVEEAISSAYYATLYATKALLATRGLETGRHSAALRLLGREFIAPGKLDRRHGKTISTLLESRISASYDAAPPFTEQNAEDFIARAREFVAAASALLDGILAEN